MKLGHVALKRWILPITFQISNFIQLSGRRAFRSLDLSQPCHVNTFDLIQTPSQRHSPRAPPHVPLTLPPINYSIFFMVFKDLISNFLFYVLKIT